MDFSADELAVFAAIVHAEGARVPFSLLEGRFGDLIDDMESRGLVAFWGPSRANWLLNPATVNRWPNDQGRETVTLTPYSADRLGVVLAERSAMQVWEVWREGRPPRETRRLRVTALGKVYIDRVLKPSRDADVGYFATVSTLVVTPYWATADASKPVGTATTAPRLTPRPGMRAAIKDAPLFTHLTARQTTDPRQRIVTVPPAPADSHELPRPGEEPLPFPTFLDVIPDHRRPPDIDEGEPTGRRERRRAERARKRRAG